MSVLRRQFSNLIQKESFNVYCEPVDVRVAEAPHGGQLQARLVVVVAEGRLGPVVCLGTHGARLASPGLGSEEDRWMPLAPSSFFLGRRSERN